MKYKITISGRGGDVYVHELNKEQRKVLSEASVDNVITSKMDYDEISEVLGHLVDESEHTFAGVYTNPKDYVILVHDENDNLIFESDDDWDFNPDAEYHYEGLFEEGDYLIVESYCKGTFFEYELETDQFDPNKLEPVVVELNERLEILKGIRYSGEELDFDWGDYDSRGYYYYLTD
jgi:hypothetical protein